MQNRHQSSHNEEHGTTGVSFHYDIIIHCECLLFKLFGDIAEEVYLEVLEDLNVL